MSRQNQAAWIAEKRARITVGDAEYPEVEDNSVIVKNAAIALNPLDFKMQDYGIMVKKWPAIIGCDVAGEIVEVGKNVSKFSPGQRVSGLAMCLVTGNQAEAAFQLYTSVPQNLVIQIPDKLGFDDAAVLPLSVAAAAGGLYEEKGLSLPLPSHKPAQTGKTLLIWGGSSSVGGSAIQLARASGLKVVATASPKNFENVERLGASAVFDYADPDVVEKLVSAIQDTKCVGAFDTIGTNFAPCIAVMEKLGGGHVAGTLDPPEHLPAGVTANHVFATTIKNNSIGAAIMQGYLPGALQDGSFVPWPAPTVIGHGLEQIQDGLDRLKQGVSASKLVVTL